MMATETEVTESPEAAEAVTETVTETQPDAVDKLVKLCGFVAGSDKYVTKEALETALLCVTEGLKCTRDRIGTFIDKRYKTGANVL